MKTKELLNYLETDNLIYLCKLSELDINTLKFKVEFNYYDGYLNGIVEVNNKDYYYTYVDVDRAENRIYVVLDNDDYEFNDWQELFNRDLDIIGYFRN